MDWFRMYHEARKDNKLAMLSDAQHRVWFNLMCLAGEQTERGTIAGYDPFPLACEVAHGDEALLSETLEFLVKARILERTEEDALTFLNWRKRQYVKPSAEPERVKARVEKHRAKEKAEKVTPLNEDDGICNDDVTRGNANPSARDRTQSTEIRTQNGGEFSSSDADAPTAEIGPVFGDDSPEYELALHLAGRMLENNPKAKHPSEKQLQNWANDVRLMVQRDERSLGDIRTVLDWSQSDSFWRANILSMGKLREKYDQVWLKMTTPIPARASPTSRRDRGMSFDQIMAKAARAEAGG